ncbi:MAG: chlorite dismutase family protein [Prosthecobacter sp.]
MYTFVNPRLFTFVGGDSGAWQVIARKTVIGEQLPTVKRLDIVIGDVQELPDGALWKLSGVTSNERYITRTEKEQLAAKQVSIGRPEATHAALIPIRKSAKWWALTQDERRAIFEESSHHVKIGMKYLPAIARRLHHCRDLAEPQPFDFITLFDYTKADSTAFEDMVAELRTTEEWKYVEREIDIRMVREVK